LRPLKHLQGDYTLITLGDEALNKPDLNLMMFNLVMRFSEKDNLVRLTSSKSCVKVIGFSRGSFRISSDPIGDFRVDIFETQMGRDAFFTQPENKIPKTITRNTHSKN